jgi:DNA-binding NarL/FixJ family response regulator
MKRLVIIADDPIAVHAIRLALRQTAGFQIVACLDGRGPVDTRLSQLVPDVVLVDDMHDPADAPARFSEAAAAAPQATLVLLVDGMEDGRVHDVFDAGADVVLSKELHPIALGTLLRETTRGNIVQRYRPPETHEDECPLTHRETEILGLAARGMTNSRIARELWITEQTVKFHLSNTYRKLGVRNRTEASRYAYLNDLVPAAAHEMLVAS